MVSELIVEVPSNLSGMATLVCPAVSVVVKVVGVKSLPELVIEKLTEPAIAFAKATVSVLLCAIPLLAKEPGESEALLSEGVVVVGVVILSFFLQLIQQASINSNEQMVIFFIFIFFMVVYRLPLR